MSELKLNTITAPHKQAARRVGRGIGSNYGKTAGRGHKGQRARSGGRRDGVFEGGQMPLHRRVPKRGFNSRLAKVTVEIRLSEIEKLKVDEINLAALRAGGLLNSNMRRARIFDSGEIKRKVTISGIGVSKGAKAAIEAAGGSVVIAKAKSKGKFKKSVDTAGVADVPKS